MKGEIKSRRQFEIITREVWRKCNKLYQTHLRYPKIRWFHWDCKDCENYAAYCLEWKEIGLCIEYALFFEEEFKSVLTHEVSHAFATFYCNKIGRTESAHGYLWRRTAKVLSELTGYNRPVAYHAYHEMELTDQMKVACKRKKNLAPK